jgi:hypothetical protein
MTGKDLPPFAPLPNGLDDLEAIEFRHVTSRIAGRNPFFHQEALRPLAASHPGGPAARAAVQELR